MAIDIRATVTCSLGTLISGSISDDYAQGSGLVKTRGACEISGIITPAVGTVVTFSYTKGGVTRNIPRKLRVLSSFADPFRRTTQVELGCKLTYLSDLVEPLKWKPRDDPDNSAYTEEDEKVITLPIYANNVALKCLTELGIGGSAALTNKFSIPEFDFGGGYVQILSDLLLSESQVGYLTFNESLSVSSVTTGGGTGVVLTAADIIDIGPINVGQLPGEAVTVSYSTLKLKEPEEPPEEEEQEKIETLNWEYEESIGTKSFITIQYTFEGDPEPRTRRFEYIPRTTVLTTYDDWDRVTKRTTTTFTIGAELNTQYYKDAASVGNESFGYGWASSEQTIVQEELYTYAVPAVTTEEEKPENYDQVVEVKRIKTEPKMGTFGAAGLSTLVDNDLYFVEGRGITEIVTSKLETGTKSVYVAEKSSYTPVTKSTTQKTLAYAYTQRGQQDFAERVQTFGTQFYETYAADALRLVDDGTEVNVVTGRETALQSRPSAADRTNAAYAKTENAAEGQSVSGENGWRTESTAELALALGSPTAQRRIELSMPYAPDDTFSGPSGGPYTAMPSDAKAKAMHFGRAQNRLLLANRNGMNIQMLPEKLPNSPFSALYVQAEGLTAVYRTNGTQWSFDSNGIICSTDALFWGGVGGIGTFWFPVAPGITTLPPEPAIVDGQMNATNVVLPYNETAIYEGRVRLGNVVTKFDYSLSLLTVVPALKIDVGYTAESYRQVFLPAATIAIAAPAPAVTSSNTVRPANVVLGVAAGLPTVGYPVGKFVAVPASTIAVAAGVPTLS